MNINRLKALSWVAALAVGGYLAYDISDFIRNRGEYERAVSQEVIGNTLSTVSRPAPPVENLVALDRVKLAFHDMNWTGERPPEPIETTKTPEKEPEPLATPVSELLKVLFVQEDTVDEVGSLAYVKFLDPGLAAAAATTEDRKLAVGESLREPHSHVRVASITVEGVSFEFDDPEREPELLTPLDYVYENGFAIVKVDEGGAILPPAQADFPATGLQWNPRQTTSIGKNRFQVGTEDVETMQRDYSRILSQDLRFSRHRDPATGQVTGLRVTDVASGSVPARHGITEGEVIRSINDHKVTSLNGAIAYVKKEAATTDTWVVVIEKQGRQYTRTYQSPVEE